jgi:hypothetical protein
MHDIILAYRQGWPWLLIYYFVAGTITFLVWRHEHLSRYLHSPKPRLILAAVLAAVFAPGVISDFWLFMIPGPAVVGFVLMLPVVVISPLAFLWASLFYIVPLVVVFYAFGSCFGDVQRTELHHVRSPNQSMKPTAPYRNASSVFVTTPCRGLSLFR